MPKVRPLVWSAKPQCETLKKNIKICMVRSGINADDIAKLFGVSRSTAYYKLKDTNKIGYGDLCRFAHIFNVEVEDLIKEGGV